MVYYAFPYLFLLIFASLGRVLNGNGKFYYWFGMLPAFLLVLLRGDVGTDTASYLSIIGNAGHDFNVFYGEVEPGFEYILKLLYLFFQDERLVLCFLSLASALLLVFSFSKDINNVVVFIALVFPIFFYDMSMNGIRYGISFSLAKIAYDLKELNKNKHFFLCLVLSATIHVSGPLVVFLLMLRRLSFKFLVMGSFLFLILLFFYFDRFLFKFYAYGDLESPNAFSGLAPLIIFLIVYCGVVSISFKNALYMTFLLALEIVFYSFAKFSYAGLRLQLLVLFVLFCALPSMQAMSSRYRALFIGFLVVVGAVGFFFKSRNMIEGEGEGASPFLPYHFIWETK